MPDGWAVVAVVAVAEETAAMRSLAAVGMAAARVQGTGYREHVVGLVAARLALTAASAEVAAAGLE